MPVFTLFLWQPQGLDGEGKSLLFAAALQGSGKMPGCAVDGQPKPAQDLGHMEVLGEGSRAPMALWAECLALTGGPSQADCCKHRALSSGVFAAFQVLVNWERSAPACCSPVLGARAAPQR